MASLQDLLGGGLPAGLLDANQMQAAEQRARNAGLLNLAFGLLQASQGQPGQRKPGLGQIIGQAGPVGAQGYQQSFDKTLKDAVTSMQIEEMRQKQADAQRMRQAQQTFQERLAAATKMQPTMQGVLDTQSNIERDALEGMSAEQVIGMAPKTRQVTDEAAANQAVMDYLRVAAPTEYAKLITKEPKSLPSAIQEYNFAVSQGYQGTFEQYQKDMKKAGATNINMPSEGERKAGFLANRVKFGVEQMAEVLGKNAPAASPEAIPTLVNFLTGSDFLTTKLTSSDRRRIETAQIDILDAALTLGTGAAYTREQIEGYRKAYFPQLGEDEATIKDKQKRLRNLLESAYISAGRAAPVGAIPEIPTPQPKPQTGPRVPSAGKAPAGVKQEVWNVMTPEQRKLWQ